MLSANLDTRDSGSPLKPETYLPLLSRHHWVNSAQATNHAYADAGIFGVAGSTEPANLKHLAQVLAAELRFTAEAPILDEELQRAKNQLESMLLMNLEMNPVAFEDIARQILASNEWKPPAFWVEKISALALPSFTTPSVYYSHHFHFVFLL